MVKTQIKKIAEQESINIKIIEKYSLSIEAKIDKYYIELINNKAKNSNNDSDIIKSNLDELERIANLYEKGLLTDEEFEAMKKKLIRGD